MHGLLPPAAGQAAAAALASEFGVRAGFVAADVVNPADVRSMIARVQSDFGALDILCNNVGIQHVAPVADFPEDK